MDELRKEHWWQQHIHNREQRRQQRNDLRDLQDKLEDQHHHKLQQLRVSIGHVWGTHCGMQTQNSKQHQLNSICWKGCCYVVLASFHKINLLHTIISGTFTYSVCSCCIALTPKTNNCYFLVRDQAGTCKNSLLDLRPLIIEALSLSWKVIDCLQKAKTVYDE